MKSYIVIFSILLCSSAFGMDMVRFSIEIKSAIYDVEIDPAIALKDISEALDLNAPQTPHATKIEVSRRAFNDVMKEQGKQIVLQEGSDGDKIAVQMYDWTIANQALTGLEQKAPKTYSLITLLLATNPEAKKSIRKISSNVEINNP